MRVVIQRVSSASVSIAGEVRAAIGSGLLILLGVADADGPEDVEWLCRKIGQLRIFGDTEGLMNLSIQDMAGEMLVVSQFTLHASTRKGNRPSFVRAARPEKAVPLYEAFIAALREHTGLRVTTGEFGADMKVSLTNDGPVTILMDTHRKE
ncbi:MAG: hypothetical protein RLY31_2650 [Bacteroidota bacterium]|jgi:D-tyrosyl-tRNA(Tyr) deacylase